MNPINDAQKLHVRTLKLVLRIPVSLHQTRVFPLCFPRHFFKVFKKCGVDGVRKMRHGGEELETDKQPHKGV